MTIGNYLIDRIMVHLFQTYFKDRSVGLERAGLAFPASRMDNSNSC